MFSGFNSYTVVRGFKNTSSTKEHNRVLKSIVALNGGISIKDTNFWQQVLWMYVMLPLTKGHPSNKDNSLAEGASFLEGDHCIHEGVKVVS